MGVVHVAAMLLLVGAVGLMRSPRLSAPGAWYVAVAGLSCIGFVAAAALYLWLAHRPTNERQWASVAIEAVYAIVRTIGTLVVGLLALFVGGQPVVEEAVEAAETSAGAPEAIVDAGEWLIRVFGRTLIAVAFFMTWALIHLLIWSLDDEPCLANPETPCGGAYRGVGEETTVGDFLYLSVNGALVNMPPDLIAHSREAHTALMLELLSGVAVVTAYAGRFLGMRAARAGGAASPART